MINGGDNEKRITEQELGWMSQRRRREMRMMKRMTDLRYKREKKEKEKMGIFF